MIQKDILPKSVWQFYKKYAFCGLGIPIVFYVIVTFICLSESVLEPLYQKWLVAIIETPLLPDETWLQHVLPTIVLIAVLCGILKVSAILRWVVYNKICPYVRNNVSVALTNYAHSQSFSWWSSRLPGKISQQITYIQDIPGLMNDILRCCCIFIMMCINSGLLFRINIYVAGMLLFAFAFRICFTCGFRKKLKNAASTKAGAQNTLNGKLIDSLSNYTIVKSFSGLKREEKYLEPYRADWINTECHYRFLNRIFWGSPVFVFYAFFIITLLLCAKFYFNNEITIADIVFTIGVFYAIKNSINTLIDAVPDIIDKVGSISKSYQELVSVVNVADVDNAPELKVPHGKIEFKNVSFKYNKNYVLHNVDLVIKPGEHVGIVGLSGTGKTTLVNLLMRFYDPQDGSILIDDQDIATVSQNSLRENISQVSQELTMFNRTIFENIEYGRPGASLQEVKSVAIAATADTFIDETDKKYDTIVGDRGIKLSGGQRQRIAIARAFLKNAPILILDEATSALDSETEIAIQKSFDKLSAGHTTLVVAHRLSTLRNMDRIIVLDKGKVIESGTHTALLRKKGLYAKLWKMQSGGFLQDK